jgi:hypothetical protein
MTTGKRADLDYLKNKNVSFSLFELENGKVADA